MEKGAARRLWLSAVQQGSVIRGGNALIFPEGPVDGQGRGITDEIADFFQGRIARVASMIFFANVADLSRRGLGFMMGTSFSVRSKELSVRSDECRV